MKIKVEGKTIGDNSPVYIIGEAGINHNGQIKNAKKMVDIAKKSGADAIKFQTFKAEDLTTPDSIYYKVFKKAELDYSDFGEISDYSKQLGITFLSTPFSEDASDFLEEMYHPIACDAEDAYIGENEILDLKPEFLEFAIDKIDATLVAKGLRGMQDDTMYEILSCYPREQALKILDCVVSLNFPKTENENNARELCKQIYMTLSKHYPTKKWDFFYENDGVEY